MNDAPGAILPQPILKPRVWGGDRLRRFGRAVAPGDSIGESWELADLPTDIDEGRSRIDRGPGAGGTLRALIERDPGFVLGDAAPAEDGGFPLLFKLLDARQDLSVQVHPTASVAARDATVRTKSEAWYVLDAAPGARVLTGFDGPAPDGPTIRTLAGSGAIVDRLVARRVVAGDCVMLPTGLCHALGAGVLAAEIQTPSDTTYRLYDWGRTDRTLHLDEAVACLTAADAPVAPPPPPSVPPTVRGPWRITPLARTDAFELDRVDAAQDGRAAVTTTPCPSIVFVLDGSLHVEDAHGPLDVPAGRTMLLPAAFARREIACPGGTRFLVATPRS